MTQFVPVFSALRKTGVRYVVVGDVAVNLHGYQRFTKDIDLVVELIPDQALRLSKRCKLLATNPVCRYDCPTSPIPPSVKAGFATRE